MKIFFILACFISIQLINCHGPYPTASPHVVKPRVATTKKFAPTNAWYQNWLLGNGENPIHTYPYMLRAKQEGLSICYPSQMVNIKAYIMEVFHDNLVLSVRESFGRPLIDASKINADFYELGLKVNFGQAFDVTVTRGAASLVAQINSATPVLKTIHAIISNEKISDKAFKVSFNNGQTWLLQTQKPLAWTVSNDISAQTSYSGWLKISIVTSQSAQTALMNAHDLLITNGIVSYSVNRATYPGEVVIDLKYNSDGLYYILPHVLNPTGTNNINGANAKGIKGSYSLSRGM